MRRPERYPGRYGDEEERRPKRRLFTFWRVVAVLALALAGWAVFTEAGPSGPYVARHAVAGLITDDPRREALLDRIARDENARALILRIDSPGGTTAGAEALFDAVRRVAAEKPVVAVMGEAAASGGYVAAIAADRVLARGNTLTGSIGVIVQTPQVSGLLGLLGVEMREVKSSPLKAAPSPFSDPPPEAVAWQRELVADSYAWFRGLVAERRGLDGAALDRVADGRVFTGRQALALGLVDALGAEREAREWLAEQGVAKDLPAREMEMEDGARGLLRRLLGDAAGPFGIAPGAANGGPRLLSILN